ncbi:related to RSM26 - mitochondrial ribosomal protein, small subunit [Cephalotrichum gorgonifer]|uniref:Related to RSM26 - mitochondrial ribosomal protein, small subunit n=1 Tax=Cephalotrichum gorgonifer TaxID=2041049 RepID=A0AAE8MWY5_9PEZI|nr:related to RSM26 - mitochondrial ribosomal protein, small subunit [Cephalotrichum gorgonifer]
MFRSGLRIPRVSLLARPAVQRASIHSLPKLPHEFKDGVPGLLSADGYDMAWTQYQCVMLEKLNSLVAGTELEQKDTYSTIVSTARDPNKAPIFNHASMAHNNHFFFKNLSPRPGPMPSDLQRDLERSFSSIETLRREFIATAMGMFGPGFVWLVQTGPSDFAILPTYLAGSPYPAAHWRRQDVDMNTTGADGSAAPWLKSTQVKGLPRKKDEAPPGSGKITPLLCLNTWEHVWLRDYGIGYGDQGGKRAFVEAWWETVDWESVAYATRLRKPEARITRGAMETPVPEETMTDEKGETEPTPRV